MKKRFQSEHGFHLVAAVALALVVATTEGCKRPEKAEEQIAGTPSFSGIQNKDHWMAIIGDSGATGAVASPRLKPTVADIGGYLLDPEKSKAKLEDIPNPEKYKLNNLEPLTRVIFSSDEKAATSPEQVRATEEATAKLDVAQYSWGYLVGRSLDIKPSDIVLVGQDGSRVDSLANQFSRIGAVKEPNLPPLVLISYNANDLCDDQVLAEPVEARAVRFEEELRKQFDQALANAKAHPKGTRIVVLAPIDIRNVLSNPNLLQQKVSIEGQGEVTCLELRKGNPAWNEFAKQTRDQLMGMCNSVLGTSPEDQPRIDKLGAVQTAFTQSWQKVAGEMNQKYGANGIRVEFLDQIRAINFEAGDLANECFHPGIRAHQKMADQVLNFLR